MIRLPPDFKDFLRLLNANEVEYLLVGGYAVAYHGYPRATGDLDIWVAMDPANARRMMVVLDAFGFGGQFSDETPLLEPDNIIRMGYPPVRIEVLTSVSGVNFEDCKAKAVIAEVDGVRTSIISCEDLKANKKAAGRPKDMDDLQNLP